MRNFQLRSLSLTFVLLWVFQFSLHAQRAVGVRWNVPQNDNSAITQLEQFDKLGISILEIKSGLSPRIWQKIDSLQFEVYGSLDIKFPVTSTFTRPDSSLIIEVQDKVSIYLSQPSVTAIGLFEYGATHKAAFFKAVQPVANQLEKLSQRKLYFVSRFPIPKDTSDTDFILFDTRVTPANIDTFSIPQSPVVDGYLYSPSDEMEKYLGPFKTFLKTTSASPEKTIFLDSNWLLSTLDKNPQFAETLYSVATETETIFPLPNESIPSPSSVALLIVILLIVWGTIAWHYHMSPLYRKSLLRYFLGHKFFINDIFQRQIRSIFPAFIIILQNALLISASCYATFKSLFSSVGRTAFFYHFSPLTFFGHTPFSIFIWIFLISLLIPIVSIIWLSMTHRSISSVTQVTTIYAWPLQLNFIFCVVVITIFSAGGSPYMITTFTVISLLVFLLSFIAASLDTLRFARSKFVHLIKTNIPYLLALSGLIIWLITKEQWGEVISLSLHLK